jgi:exodeoxyribonuclease VII small subunit
VHQEQGKKLAGSDPPTHRHSMAKKKETLSFEAALGQLESLVASMEAGDIPLAQLVEKFEEGSKLVKMCEERLKNAELTIQKLQEAREEVVLEAFDPEAED